MPTTETQVPAQLDLTWSRAQFPALAQTVNGHPAVFLDGPGGTQVPQPVIDAISGYLRRNNANTGGAYATSRNTDAMIAEARSAMADFFNCDPDEVVFGPNMTTLTYAISRSIGRELHPGDEILLTHLDHDANISPWRALEEHGVTIRLAEINEEDCTLDIEDLASKITGRTKLVAVGYASNAVGTINAVETIIRLAHKAGALAYIDAVHYAPHGPIDVRALDCDFLVCSTYKFFGPHMVKLYGIRDPQRFDRRCPTVAVRIKGSTPLQLARKLGERGFFTWDGNYYALNLTERLDVEKDGGFLRIGLAHYNTTEEVERLLAALREIVSR